MTGQTTISYALSVLEHSHIQNDVIAYAVLVLKDNLVFYLEHFENSFRSGGSVDLKYLTMSNIYIFSKISVF